MKNVLKISLISFCSICLLVACTKDEDTDPNTTVQNPTSTEVPTLTTDTSILIYWDYTARSWATKGRITSNGSDAVTSSGICWAKNNTPTISDNKSEKLSTSSLNITITGLESDTEYWFRTYATNGSGTGYGNAVKYKTPVEDGIESTVTDIEGNSYKTVTMRGKEWMAENLNTTKLNDGTAITNETGSWAGKTTALYTYYDNDKATNEKPYGAMYNYYTVETEKLCPTGWHVATTKEWEDIAYHWGGASKAALKLKEKGTTHFRTTQTDVDNQSKLTLLPGGSYENGRFNAIRDFAQYWKKSLDQANGGKEAVYILAQSQGVSKKASDKENGYSVRCVKD